MFAPTALAAAYMEGDYSLAVINSVRNETSVKYSVDHPFWSKSDPNGKKKMRPHRILSLLLMADLVEAGATF
jgi:hypothetical protein